MTSNNTNIRFEGVQDYTCKFNGADRKLSTRTHRKVVFDELAALCFPTDFIEIMFGTNTFFLLSITFISIIYRFKYELLYFWLKWQAKIRKDLSTQEVYEFDGFVAYCEADYTWVRHELLENLEFHSQSAEKFKLCFHHRNFLPGARGTFL